MYTSDLFYYLISVHVLLLVVGLVMLTGLLVESYYVKTFIAMSSILNSVFIFLALIGVTSTEVFPTF